MKTKEKRDIFQSCEQPHSVAPVIALQWLYFRNGTE